MQLKLATTLILHSDHRGPDLFNTAHGPRSCRPMHLSALYSFRRPMLQGILINLTFPVPRQLVYGHFVYDTSSTDISSTDISSTTVYQRVAQLYIQLPF